MHGQDNTDKTANELQQGEEVPQVSFSKCSVLQAGVHHLCLACDHCKQLLYNLTREAFADTCFNVQARIVAYSDSDEEDFSRNKWQAVSGSESDEEGSASPVDHEAATVNVKQKQLIRKPPPGNRVSIGAGPVAAAAGFCGQYVTPKLEKVLVPQNAIRVCYM